MIVRTALNIVKILKGGIGCFLHLFIDENITINWEELGIISDTQANDLLLYNPAAG